jgi:hypothetical protein
MITPNIHVVVTMRTAIVSDNVVESFNDKISAKALHSGFKCFNVYKNNTNKNMNTGRLTGFKGRCENAFGAALQCDQNKQCVIVINGNNGNAMERLEWMSVLRSKISYVHCASMTFCVMSPNAHDANIALNERARFSATMKNRSHNAIQEQMTAQQQTFTPVQREELPYSYPLATTMNMKVVRPTEVMNQRVSEQCMDNVFKAIFSRGETSDVQPYSNADNFIPWDSNVRPVRKVPVSWDE